MARWRKQGDGGRASPGKRDERGARWRGSGHPSVTRAKGCAEAQPTLFFYESGVLPASIGPLCGGFGGKRGGVK